MKYKDYYAILGVERNAASYDMNSRGRETCALFNTAVQGGRRRGLGGAANEAHGMLSWFYGNASPLPPEFAE